MLRTLALLLALAVLPASANDFIPIDGQAAFLELDANHQEDTGGWGEFPKVGAFELNTDGSVRFEHCRIFEVPVVLALKSARHECDVGMPGDEFEHLIIKPDVPVPTARLISPTRCLQVTWRDGHVMSQNIQFVPRPGAETASDEVRSVLSITWPVAEMISNEYAAYMPYGAPNSFVAVSHVGSVSFKMPTFGGAARFSGGVYGEGIGFSADQHLRIRKSVRGNWKIQPLDNFLDKTTRLDETNPPGQDYGFTTLSNKSGRLRVVLFERNGAIVARNCPVGRSDCVIYLGRLIRVN